MNDCEPALRWRVWATVLIIVGAGLITNAWKLQHLNPRYVELFGEEFKLVSQGLPHDPIDLRSVERYVPLWQTPLFHLAALVTLAGVVCGVVAA